MLRTAERGASLLEAMITMLLISGTAAATFEGHRTLRAHALAASERRRLITAAPLLVSQISESLRGSENDRSTAVFAETHTGAQAHGTCRRELGFSTGGGIFSCSLVFQDERVARGLDGPQFETQQTLVVRPGGVP